MKIFVVSGFLGAGKTTFIRELARRTHRDFAVMENEYGEVGIDGAVLSEESPLNIWEMTEGCICCSMKADFASSILTIANTLDPEYLVVEPTGVGLLSKVLENIRQIEYERISLLSPITLLDGTSFQRYLREFPEIYRDQIAAAGTIAITKMEHADGEELARLERELRALNPHGEILATHYTQNPDGWWERLLTRPLSGAAAPETDAQTPDLENLGLTGVKLAGANQLVLLLQGVVSGVFGDICRAKGYLEAGGAWLRFDVVDRTYTITGCQPMPESRAVFIGKELRRGLLRQALQQELWRERAPAASY